MEISKKGKLFVVTGSSGSGKTTLVNAVIKDLSESYSISRVITYTTKTPRPNEVDGQDYHFISIDSFNQKIKQDFFIEYSNEYISYYGSPKNIFDKINMGHSYILIADLKGLKSIAQKDYSFNSILIKAPINKLEFRLNLRGQDSISSIQKRLSLAEQEEKQFQNVKFDFVLNNIILSQSIKNLKDYILNSID